MIENHDSLAGANPFWFVGSELLVAILRGEIEAIAQLFAKCPNLHKSFDVPKTTIPQRARCFELLARRQNVETINETLLSRFEKPVAFDEEESRALSASANLVVYDALAWVREMKEVAECLPSRIHAALPEPLRNELLCVIDPAQKEIVRFTAETLNTVEQIQALTARVFDEQLQRLKERWSAELSVVPGESRPQQYDTFPDAHRDLKRKPSRTRDKQRIARDRLIAEIEDISETITEFLALMDERKVKPQPTWIWPGSWQKAYKDSRLRRLIHQDKSRALSRARRHK